NHYGPTETVVGCSLYDASAHLRAGDSTREEIPIGYAMANTGLYVVDAGGELQAKGGVGELYVGGPCVAKGYVGDPDRTAASFVYVPWLADTRLYRTGDRVRRLESGALVFLGRKDEQVKLRGYRIELGEIRSVLAQQAVVKQAAVLVQGEGADATLVGYVVAEGEVVDEGIFIAELERALSSRLASYMCPSRWCLLDALPLTANGKLDRGALPSEIGEIGQEYEAAENSVERALVEIWAEVLRQPLEELSVTGDFFRLGGNSLLAVKIISEINARYKLQLGLKELFSYPSIRRLAVLMQQSGLGENNPEIPALPRDGQALPLSYAQQRLWFIEQLATQPNAQFNMPLALRIRGQLETNTLEQAIAAVIKRHEILRTVYQLDQDGEPQQVILPAFAPRITTLELNGSEQEKLNQAHANVAAQALQPFNLQSDHMLKVQLLQLGKHDYVLAIVVHHIACDGWSLNILLNDIMAFYDAISSAQAPTLEPLTIQYADFASWQRRYLGGERLQHGLDFWLSHLDQAPPLHSIPLDRNRAPDQFSGARVDGTIAPDIVNELELFAQQHQSTLFMLLQTMFAVTVGRFSREQDVVMGMPAVNRNNKSCQNMIGLFLNTLVVRTQFDTQQPIGELLRKAKQTHMEIHAHSEVPFELLVEQLNPERSLTHAPIFQLFINMANEQLALSTESQLEVSAFSAQQEFDSKYDITLYLRPTHSGLKFIFAYNAALFDCSTITALANEFSSTLYQVAANPQLNVAQLKWSQPLKENAAVTLCEHEVSSVHQLFELNLSKHAASGALHYAEQKLSFEELNEQSNKLAHYLIKQHAISKGQTVGIHCQRNATRIIAMLAVLKAGATLVPLSVELPASRLKLQAEDADITLLLHDEQTEASFFERATLDCSSLLRESTLDQYSGENPDVEVFSDDIAHIIYTSGSTGKPKGVLGTHGAVVNRVSWMLQRFPLASNEVTVMMTSMAFIRGMWEFYVSLAAIKPVVLLPREQVKDNNLFVAAIEKHKITRIVTTPSHLQSLVISGAQYRSTLSSLRYWFISGEALSLSLAERCCKWLDEVEFYNLYGSTEVMSDVLYSNIKEDVARGVITLGQAITNNHVLLVDEQLQRIPTGAVGEVLVVGSNVAAGYLLRPEQTKAAFVEYDGQRAYRTGDLAKYLADGRLVGLGRKDKQVKIRGFRVEVDEIASLLRNRPEVDDAIVLVKGTELQQRLIAYLNVGCRAVKPSQLEQIKVYLSDHLPDYMVPSHFVTVENWPLTINGKLQYSALPEPTYQNDQMQVVPSTETEHQLLEIWQGLLNVTTIGVTDSFFALGGHSLLATRLVSQVEATFGLTIALKAVFENSTIQLLAQHIDNHGKASLGAITPAPKGKQIPLSYAQQRLWFVEQVSPSNQYNMPLAYQVTGKFALQVAEQALQYLVNRHAVLRTQYQFDGQTAYQEVQESWQVRLTVSDLTHLSEQQQKDSIIDLLRSFYQRVFVLEEQPPFEIHYICQSSEQGILLFNLHHIAADAWSMGILMSEFIHCYQAIEAGVDPQLPALSIQYSDFAYWQRQRLDDVFLAEQLAYWRTQLQDVPSIHNLPLDRPRPSVRAQQGAIYESCLSGEIVQQLEKVASQHNVSMYMLFHAALAFLVSKLSGQQDVVIGCPIANRTNVEVEPLIGLFVNTLVLRTQVQQESFNGLLEHIRTVNLDAQAHQDVPFEQLVDLCKLLRTSSHTPLVQVVLNLNNIGQSVAGIEGLEFTPLEQQSTIAKTDLNLGVVFAGGKWVINWTYDVALFDADTIERFSSYFIRILHQVAHNPRIALSDIDLLNEQTQQALVAMSRGPELAPTRIQQVHQFLENQVTRTPEAIALVSDTQSYNYQELNSAVNKLSNYLLKLELPRQATVGICMERCSDMVIAMYAVAKAGLVFTPLDPEQPQARRAFIISNAKVHLVLSHQQFEPILRQIPALAVAYIDSVATNQLITQCSNINPEIGGHNTDLAYIMYTSGSSGEPKGVQIEHRQIIAATQSRLDAYRVPAGRFLSLSSIYFDSCLLGIFSVLAQGAELHIVKDSDVVDIGAVYRYIMASDITHLAILPTMYRALLQYANLMAALPSQLRLVITGGEGVEQDLQQLHFESQWSQGARFFNEYGPTEATVWSSHYEIKADDSFQVAPIGRPAGHVNLYVMDHYGHLTPQGCEGELHIGGVGVARGYMDNAELTNGHFFSRQLYSGESERLYRTGDVVRYNKHGDIEFVGRKDNQVKIRGYRVELSEIEQQILHHPDVLDCVTKVWQEQGEEKLLIAYLQIRERQSEQAVVAAVKKQLAQTLPSYMQPNAITSIGHIPVNRNGKVDRKALPKPNLAALTGEYSPAQNSTQKKLLTIWAELLHLSAEEISINADFFELGGHSLLAVQLVTKVNETFPVDLSIKEIFSSPVLCDLADQVDALLHLDEDELAAAEAELADMSDEEIEKLYQELCDE
ncbi:amino acid adenylation domain-containing protein, partial [Pseudoalteromonas sp. XMcav11-Q]|uniref:amino acid adenylation domain-containing protein n=1 Tax=Pseudoalteromonas sp. XMcav11-Q TaxID=3136665 RepID=UPI0032C44C2C